MQLSQRLKSLGSSLPLLPAVACSLIAAFVLVDTTQLIIRYFNPLSYGDAWATVESYQRFVSGQYTLSDLFSQHNEHRIAVPRLVFLADFALGRGLNIINESTIFLIQLFHAILLVRIATLVLNGVRLAVAIGLVFVLLLNFGQAENLTWGFQVSFVSVYAAATLAFWWFAEGIARDGKLRPTLLLALSFVMSLVSTYSMSNGFISALVLVTLAAVGRASRGTFILTALFAVATTTLYFHDFSLNPDHSPPGFITKHPLAFFHYMFTYLGGPLGRFGTSAAASLGVTGAILTAAAAVRACLHREPSPRVALLGVMLFVSATAAVTAFGRASFGVDQALESRYLTPVCVFWASHFIYWASFGPLALPRAATATLSFVTILVLAGVLRSHATMRSMMPWTYRQQNFATAIVLSGVRRPDVLAANHLPPADKLEQLSRFLAQQRLNVFALPLAAARDRSLEVLNARRDDTACEGADGTEPNLVRADASTSVAGWGWDNLAMKPVERVLIVDAGDRVTGFASGGWFWYRPNSGDSSARRLFVGWRGFAAKVTKENSAFALLDGGRVVCRLPRSAPPASLDGSARGPARIDLSKLGEPIEAQHVLEGGWTPKGQPVGGVPAVIGATFGSWVAGTGVRGLISMGPFVVPSRQFALPFITGADTSNASIQIIDAETGQIYAMVRPEPTPIWSAIRFDVPRAIAGHALIVKGISTSGSVDEWLALGGPHTVRP